jgi:16S rRNA (uracil1498-N3)-methyltransferase
MRLHRFYINEKVGEKTEITLPDTDLSHQIGNVFRLNAGDSVIVFDGSGFEYVSEIVSISKKELVLKIVESVDKRKNEEGKKKVSLYFALIKKGNFELAVEKCTELGVTEIHPLVSDRSEKKDINLERLQKIVKEASEQCGRVTLPRIYPHETLETLVSQAKSQNEVSVAFHTAPGLPSFSLSSVEERAGVRLFLGPEGGWTEKEIALFKEHNVQLCSLGQNILRAETAAIVAVWSQSNNL